MDGSGPFYGGFGVEFGGICWHLVEKLCLNLIVLVVLIEILNFYLANSSTKFGNITKNLVQGCHFKS